MHISAYEARLERIAEEFMGRRKWKHFQDSFITRNYFNTEQSEISTTDQSNLEKDKATLTLNKISNGNNNNNNIENIAHNQNGDQEKFNSLEENGKDFLNKNNSLKNNLNQKEISSNINNTPSESDQETESAKATEATSILEPIDWKPNEKCYFCIDGKLLTVNSNGELVAETGPILPESDHIIKNFDSDSNSNDSKNIVAAKTLIENHKELSLYKLLKLQQKNMTSMDSMVTRSIPPTIPESYTNINWLYALHQQQENQQQQIDQAEHLQQPQTTSVTPTTSETSTAAISPALKDSPSPSYSTGEQPLDLSSKPSPNSSISGDTKMSSRRKTTPTPTGRRTYSQEDLKNALDDIQNSRLGTRKAAAQYNIPRSTLRNKKNKLANEVKGVECQDQEMNNDISDDEADRSSNSTPQTMPNEDFMNRSVEALSVSSNLNRIFQNSSGDLNDDNSNGTTASPKPNVLQNDGPANKRQCSTPSNLGLPLAQTPLLNLMDPNLLLQTILLSSGALQPELDKTVTIRELLSTVMMNMGKDFLANQANNSNQTPAEETPPIDNGKRLLLQQLQKQQQPLNFQNMLIKSETPETTSSMDTLEASDDPHSLIKIPSFKPAANSGNSSTSLTSGSSNLLTQNDLNNLSSHRNGESPGAISSPNLSNPSILSVTGNRQIKNLPVMSPSQQASNLADSQQSPTLSLRDIITSGIHRSMNEQATKDAHAAASMLSMGPDADRYKSNGDFKKGTIYVAKHIGGTDTSSFGTVPNLLAPGSNSHHGVAHHSHHPHLLHSHSHPHAHAHAHPHLHSRHHAEQLSRQEAAALAAGKGTRPKRGKYRNYDRSSLVEAVKAVQRGEMSVHRAGSYYGVPHSTLEYKVKERHLMRPRKREPKPQAGLEGSTTNSSNKSNSNIPGLNSHDKHKSASSNGQSSKLSNALKGGSCSSAGSPMNGLKSLSIFDSPHLPYNSPLFWPGAAGFGSLQMDFNRNAGGPNDIMDLYKKETLRAASANSVARSASTNSSSPSASPLAGQNHQQALHLNDLAENMGENVLGGIIRKTLNRNSSDLLAKASAGSGALLDQLLINSGNLPFVRGHNDYDCSSSSNPLKRSASPLSYNSDIKRERGSSDDEDDDDGEETSRSALGADETHENNNNNNSNSSKYHNEIHERSRLTSRDSETDGSSIKSELHNTSHQNHNNNSANNIAMKMNEINGKNNSTPHETGTSILQEKLAQIKAEQNENEHNL